MLNNTAIHLCLSPFLDAQSLVSNETLLNLNNELGVSLGLDVNVIEQELKHDSRCLVAILWLPPEWTMANSFKSLQISQEGILEFEKQWVNGVRAQLRLKKLYADRVAIIDVRELAANVSAGLSWLAGFTGLPQFEKIQLNLNFESNPVTLALAAQCLQGGHLQCEEMLAASESLNPSWQPSLPSGSGILQSYAAALTQADLLQDDLKIRLAALAEQRDAEINDLHQKAQQNIEMLFSELQNAFKESEDFFEQLEERTASLESTQQELHEIHQANHHRFLLVNALQNQCADLAAERDSILGSTCWRITSPIRWLRRLLGLGRFNSSEPLDQQIIKHSALYIRRRPALKAFVLKVLLRNPGLHAKVVPVLGEIKRQESAILHQQNPANAPELTNHAKRILQRLESEMQSKPSQVNS
jgi:two-component sensor histidine kinase